MSLIDTIVLAAGSGLSINLGGSGPWMFAAVALGVGGQVVKAIIQNHKGQVEMLSGSLSDQLQTERGEIRELKKEIAVLRERIEAGDRESSLNRQHREECERELAALRAQYQQVMDAMGRGGTVGVAIHTLNKLPREGLTDSPLDPSEEKPDAND